MKIAIDYTFPIIEKGKVDPEVAKTALYWAEKLRQQNPRFFMVPSIDNQIVETQEQKNS